MSKPLKISKENEPKYIRLGRNIAYYRKQKGYTQEVLAGRCGLSRSYIRAIEAPNLVQTISLEALFTISKALEVEACKLLVFKEEACKD
ncbi:MAG: helix-turn-helix domain-containing protein [Christensenellales bacterium]|jgi:transcriptional regulator with XRE-family HTH domain